MFLRKAKANYSGKAVRAWLDALLRDWEKRFSPSQLEKGRRFYKQGFVSSIDLGESEAFVNFKFPDNSQPYCVVGVENNALTFRSSIAEKDATYALCCAALYEIQELVCDAMPSLPDSAQPSTPESDLQPQTPVEAEPEKARDFLLSFTIYPKGLRFVCHLLDGKKRLAVYGGKNAAISTLNSSEKEQLVRLAAFSKKAGFSYEKNTHYCGDIGKIESFARQYLPVWKKFFKIESNGNLQALAKGVRNADLSASLSLKDGKKTSFCLDWSLVLGGETIDNSFLKQLSSGNAVLVPQLGAVRLNAEYGRFYSALEKARNKDTNEIPSYILLSLFSEFSNAKFSDELRHNLYDFENAKLDSSEEPAFLREYQKKGVCWAKKLFSWNCSALLADEMGLGKTAQTLTLVNEFCKDNKTFAIVVCPASVIPVWEGECAKFFGNIKCAVLNSAFDFASNKAQLIISSYTQLRKNKAKIESANFELAVLDEAQFIKNPEAKTTAACMSINAKHKIALTGTPLENDILDLWTIFRWLMPNLLPDKTAFAEMYAQDPKAAVEKIRRQISPFCLRRLKKDIDSQLPEKIYSDLLCPLSPLQKSEYEKYLRLAKADLAESIEGKNPRARMGVLALLTRLRQACCDASLLPNVDCSLFDGGKISALTDKVQELYFGKKKVLVFSQFTSFLKCIKAAVKTRVPQMEIYELTGSTRDRVLPVKSFQETKNSALILVSLKAGGTGITLTEADYVFFMDPWWNPAVEEQAIDRVHRIGRKGDVFVYKMYARGTVEDAVRRLQIGKKELFENMFGNIKDVSESSEFAQTLSLILNAFDNNNTDDNYEDI